MKGMFITVEGPDGAGKTSLINELGPLLKEGLSASLLLTREPGGSVLAEKIRQLILDPRNTMMDERTEALLYAAARRQHLVEKVLPALERGEMVLCDRFVDSSIAYQGAGRRIGVQAVAELNEFAIEGLVPDLTLYLDVDTDTGLQRIKQGRTAAELDRLDIESNVFHQRVRHAYLRLAEENTERIVTINARQSLDLVVKDCLQVIQQAFPHYFKM